MFLNLIKNELKSTIKNYLIVYLAFIASTIIAAIFIILKVPVVLLFISILSFADNENKPAVVQLIFVGFMLNEYSALIDS